MGDLGFSPSFSLEELKKHNRNVYVNFGLIACGPISEIEKLQELIINHDNQNNLRIVYAIVSAKRLRLVKVKRIGDKYK